MIPYLLAVAGGYLIGNAFKDNMQTFASGGEVEDKIKVLEKELKNPVTPDSVKEKIKEKIEK
jgi:hypothetical protein